MLKTPAEQTKLALPAPSLTVRLQHKGSGTDYATFNTRSLDSTLILYVGTFFISFLQLVL